MNNKLEPERRGARWTMGGAIAAAVFASACCLLPVFFGGMGVSALAMAGLFEPIRPYFLGVAGLLLALGFYYSYFRKQECAPGEACEVPRPGLRRFNRSMLWLGTVAVVALALFPSYARVFAGDVIPAKPTVEEVQSETVVFEVSGMTCEACAVSIQRELAQVPGVLSAAVKFETSEAVVEVDAGTRPTNELLAGAVKKAGYSAALKTSAEEN